MGASGRKKGKLRTFLSLVNKNFYQKYRKIILSIVGLLLVGTAVVSMYKKIDYNWNWEIVPKLIVYYGEAPEDKPLRRKVAKVVEHKQDGTLVLKALDEIKADDELYFWLLTPAPANRDMDFTIEASQINGNWKKGKTIEIKKMKAPKTFSIVPGTIISIKKVGWHAGPILRGTGMTIFISFTSILLAIFLGTLMGLWRVSSSDVLRFISKTYVELVRGTPLLVQIYVFYFFIGKALDLSNLQAGIAALSFFAGAYVAEIIRAGIQSIPKGQMEASRALGMSYFQAMRYIILPQAFRRILPPLAGQFISLIKDSSLVSIISLNEITFSAQQSITTTFATFEIWFAAAGVYLILTSALSAFTHYLERRLLL